MCQLKTPYKEKRIKDIHKEFKNIYAGIKSDDGLNAQMNDFLKNSKIGRLKQGIASQWMKIINKSKELQL